MTIEQLKIGEQVRLGGSPRSWWWDVRATDERFTILTHAEPNKPHSAYTIIDRERGVRGPCDLIGQGWDVDEEGGCESLLRALNYHLEVSARLDRGEESVTLDETSTEVSYRNNVPIEILGHYTPSSASA